VCVSSCQSLVGYIGKAKFPFAYITPT